MSDYSRKRIEYINNWPNVDRFDVEKIYSEKLEGFRKKTKRYPYQPMKLWDDEPNKKYNITVSFIIDSLEMINQYPNHAFAFIFKGIDLYGKYYINESNETKCLKQIAGKFNTLISNNYVIKDTIDTLFNSIPVSVYKYLFAKLYKNDNTSGHTKDYTSNNSYRHLIQNENGNNIPEKKDFFDKIYNKYGYGSNLNNRNGALLFRKILTGEKIDLDGIEYSISYNDKLNILLNGILYSLRNDYMHGMAISSDKSSMGSLTRSVMYYDCYIVASTVLNIILIEKANGIEKEEKYKELNNIVKANVNDMKTIFKKELK